jgi:hypothetical protein
LKTRWQAAKQVGAAPAGKRTLAGGDQSLANVRVKRVEIGIESSEQLAVIPEQIRFNQHQ